MFCLISGVKDTNCRFKVITEKPTEGERGNYPFPTQIRVNIVTLRKVENFNNEAHTSLYQKSWKLVFYH